MTDPDLPGDPDDTVPIPADPAPPEDPEDWFAVDPELSP